MAKTNKETRGLPMGAWARAMMQPDLQGGLRPTTQNPYPLYEAWQVLSVLRFVREGGSVERVTEDAVTLRTPDRCEEDDLDLDGPVVRTVLTPGVRQRLYRCAGDISAMIRENLRDAEL